MFKYRAENNILCGTLLYFVYHAESSVNQYQYFEMGIFSYSKNMVQQNTLKCFLLLCSCAVKCARLWIRVVMGCADGEELQKDLTASSERGRGNG